MTTEKVTWRVYDTHFIAGLPKGQPRARSAKGMKGVYDPGTADHWKMLVRASFEKALPEVPFDEPLRIDMDFFFKRPKVFNKRTREAYDGTKNIPSGVVLHTSKPDRDNLEKAVLDAMVNVGYMRDDSLVVAGQVRKFYHARDGRPGAIIVVSRLGGRQASEDP